jgi:hypothetical protein
MHGKIAGEKAQAMVAAHAQPVVEMNDLIAIVAGKQPHGSPLQVGYDGKCPPHMGATGIELGMKPKVRDGRQRP